MFKQLITIQHRLSAWAGKVRASPDERSEIGAVLLGVGVLLIVARLIFEIATGIFLSGPSMSGFAMHPAGDIDPNPSYAGTIVVGLGICLMIVGWLAVRPWKSDQDLKRDQN
jgi:hypothetical protein